MSREIKFIFPTEELKKFTKTDVGTSLFCTSFINGKKYGGLLLVCDNALIKKLNVEANNSSELAPDFAFRRYTDNRLVFEHHLIEFDMQLDGVKEATKFHLRQDSKCFRDFCKHTIKHKAFGVLFHNVDTRSLFSKYLYLQDDEDLDWLERNFEMSKTQLVSKFLRTYGLWEELSTMVQKQCKEPSSYFLQNPRVEFLDAVREKKIK